MRVIRKAKEGEKLPLPIIGKIKVGMKKKSAKGKEYPAALDYFIATGDYANKFNDQFDKVNKLTIAFVSDNLELSCRESFICRNSAGQKVGYGDGKKFYMFNPDTNEYDKIIEDIEKISSEEKKAHKNAGIWKHNLTLRFIVLGFKDVMGIWELSTDGAKTSIGQIVNTFDNILASVGTIKGIPFDLSVHMHTSNKPGVKRKYPVIKMIPSVGNENIQKLAEYIEQGKELPFKVLASGNIGQLPSAEKDIQ